MKETFELLEDIKSKANRLEKSDIIDLYVNYCQSIFSKNTFTQAEIDIMKQIVLYSVDLMLSDKIIQKQNEQIINKLQQIIYQYEILTDGVYKPA